VSQYTLEPLLKGVAETLPGLADYLVGCDGGRSTVRKQLGIALEGDGGIAKGNQVFFRSGNLFELCPWDQCRMHFFANSDQSIMTVQDDLEHFSFHTNCFGSEDDIRALMYETFGRPIDIEIISGRPRHRKLTTLRFGAPSWCVDAQRRL
jgi:hypothetical protein